MSQSSIIVAALIIGFLIYITVKGELPSYKAILLGTSASSSTASASSTQPASSASTPSASTSATSPSLTGLTAASEELG